MNYKLHYDRLIKRAQGRKLSGYRERHHIVPKCLGGDNSKANVVELTAEEHYVAHQLLVKIYPTSERLAWAAMNMTGNSWKHSGRTNKLYGWLRRRVADRVSKRLKGVSKTPEHRAALSAAKLGKKRGAHSDIHRKRISLANIEASKSKDYSHLRCPEYRRRQSERMKEIWKQRKINGYLFEV